MGRQLRYCFCIFLISISAVIHAQEPDFIRGILIDSKTAEPIAFASIRIKDRSLGVISNIDGGFKIPKKYKEYGDIIEISSMGYQNYEVLVSDLTITKPNIIRLVPAVIELEEAIVGVKRRKKRELNAKQIVQRAIDAIPNNYPEKPYSKVGYYRDYQMENGEYLNLNEAIIEVYDQGFKSIDTATTKALIYDYVRNENFKRDTLSDKTYDYRSRTKTIKNAYLSGYGGNEFIMLKVHDPIRNYRLNTFDFINNLESGDILKNHTFKKLENTILNGRMLYVIQFKKTENRHAATGIIYIGVSDFAIHKLEYTVFDESELKKKKRRESESGYKGEIIYKISTEYKADVGNTMFLNYISFNNTFQVRQPAKFILESLSLDMGRGNFILTFNNTIDAENAATYKNYKLYFKGERIKLERLVVVGNQVLLFPKLKSSKQLSMWEVLKSEVENDKLDRKMLTVDIKNIRDIDGNLINDRVLKDYDQFREFFVQKIKLNPKVPLDHLLMKKRKPIFEDQPMKKPDNFDDYWMNTPLKSIKE